MTKAFVFYVEEGSKRASLGYCKENNISVLNWSNVSPYDNLHGIDLKNESFDLIFIGLAFGYREESEILSVVKKLRLDYAVMIDHFWNLERRLDQIIKLNYLPRKVIVRSKKCAKKAILMGIPSELIEVYEFSQKEFGTFSYKTSQFVAFISEWQFGSDVQNEGSYDEANNQDFENLLTVLLNYVLLLHKHNTNIKVYICLHPMDPPRRYQSIYQNFSNNLYEVGNLEVLRLARPKAMVGFNSAVLIEGILNYIPVITLKQDNSLLHNYYSQVTACESPTQLVKVLDDLC